VCDNYFQLFDSFAPLIVSCLDSFGDIKPLCTAKRTAIEAGEYVAREAIGVEIVMVLREIYLYCGVFVSRKSIKTNGAYEIV
jgi:hypothetical protein